MLSDANKIALVFGFMRFCARLPLWLNHAMGASLGAFYVLFPSRDRRIVWVNLTIAYPEMSGINRAKLCTAYFLSLGKTLTELGPLWMWSKDRLMPLVREVRGQALLDNAFSGGKGAMVLCPHMGTWELVGPFLSVQHPMTILYQPFEQPEIAAFMQAARERLGAKLVPTDMSGVRALLSSLKRNEFVGILPDQDPGDNGGIYAPFFTKPANTMVLASKLLRKSHAPVFFTVCERLSWGRGYRLHVLAADSDIYSEDDLISVTALNEGVERCVALNPSQYVWNYKRWRRQVDGLDPYQR